MKMLLPPCVREDFLEDAFNPLDVRLSPCAVSTRLCSMCSQRDRGKVHGVIISPWGSGRIDTHTHAVCLPLAYRNRVTEKPTARKRCLPLISWRAQSTWFGKYGGTTATQNTDCFSQEVSILEGFLQTNDAFPSVFQKCSCACQRPCKLKMPTPTDAPLSHRKQGSITFMLPIFMAEMKLTRSSKLTVTGDTVSGAGSDVCELTNQKWLGI